MWSAPSSIAVLYLALPAMAAGWAIFRAYQTRSRVPVLAFVLSAVVAAAIAVAMHLGYAWLVGATIRPGQVLVTLYLVVGVLAMFRAAGWWLKEIVDRLFRVRTLDGRLAIARSARPGTAGAGLATTSPTVPPTPIVPPTPVVPAAPTSAMTQADADLVVAPLRVASPDPAELDAPAMPVVGSSSVYLVAPAHPAVPTKASATSDSAPATAQPPQPTRPGRAAPTSYAAVPPGGGAWVARAALATVVRGVLLFGLTLVYIIAVGMIYRPKLADGQTPDHQPGVSFEPVAFTSTDGLRLAGWWMPAGPRPATRPAVDPARARGLPGPFDDLAAAVRAGEDEDPARHANAGATPLGPPAHAAAGDDWGRRTVVLCHGVGPGKSTVLALARELVPYGFNVLAFDFRGHGDSDGVLATFGDAERNDVLGAVRWVRQARPAAAGRVFGVGVDTGAAALVAAAADPSDAGRAIDAVALFGVFDSLSAWADARSGGNIPRPIDWVARHLSAPLAGLHAGADLAAFSPAVLVERVAPRPVLVVHGRADEVVPFDEGAAVYEAASQPKLRFWVGQQDALKRWVLPTTPPAGGGGGPGGGSSGGGGASPMVPPAVPGLPSPGGLSGPSARTLPPGAGAAAATVAPAKPADHARTVEDDEAARAVRLFFETVLPLL